MSLFLGFFDSSLYPDTGVWPPEGIVALDPFDLPLINTLILLLSGCTVTWSHHALQHDNRKDFITGLVLTIILGAIFTAVQAYEYQHATFAFTDGIYASTFYMATGFHGFHVLVGTIFLTVCLFRGLIIILLLIITLGLKQQLGIGILLMLFGYFYLFVYIGGVVDRYL